MSHLSRAAKWNNPTESVTYFDSRDMERYGYATEDEFIVAYTNRLKLGPMAGFDYILEDKNVLAKFKDDQGKAKTKAREDNQKAVLQKLGITNEEWKALR